MKTYVRFVWLAAMYAAKYKWNALLRFHYNAFSAHDIVDSDICMTTIQRNALFPGVMGTHQNVTL